MPVSRSRPSKLVMVVVVFLFAVVTVAPPAGAHHVGNPPPLLHEGGAEAPGWVVFKIDPNGEHTAIDFAGYRMEDTPTFQLAWIVINAEKKAGSGLVYTASLAAPNHYGASVSTDLIGDDGLEVDAYADYSNDWTIRVGLSFNRPGSENEPIEDPYYVALWAANVGAHDFQLYGEEDVELLGVEEDITTYFYSGRDFAGPLTATAAAPYVGASAVVDGTVQHEINNTMIGHFRQPDLATRGFATAQMPDGTTQDCNPRCFWINLFGANGPGDYTFRHTGAGAGLHGWQHATLTVADIRVPE